jgi:octaprenyl-diphosphate synthase
MQTSQQYRAAAETPPVAGGIEAARALIATEMAAMDQLIRDRLASDVVLVDQLGHYIVNSGGKRLRPILVLLAARACRYAGPHHVNMAAVIEFIHTATLLHDDVVDASALRRGSETANAIWGNEASVLVGDFLYSRAFQMMVEVGNLRIMEIMAGTTNVIAEGEVMQLMNVHDADTTEAHYLEVIRCKTAQLFEAATQVLATYGRHLGNAFQLIDDVLDYRATPEETGKNLGDDLAEGKPTLPLIRAMATGTPDQARLIRQAIEQGGRDLIHDVISAVESTGAIDYTAALARDEAQRAGEHLRTLPESPYREALYALADFAVNRTY